MHINLGTAPKTGSVLGRPPILRVVGRRRRLCGGGGRARPPARRRARARRRTGVRRACVRGSLHHARVTCGGYRCISMYSRGGRTMLQKVMAQQRLLVLQQCHSSRCADVFCAQGATIAGWARSTRVAMAAALAAAAGTTALSLEPAGPAVCRGKTANEPLAPNHRVSIVAGVLRNAVWEKDPRCRDLATLLQHLKTAGYNGTETGCGDLIMCFYPDKSPEEAIPIIREEFRRAGMQPLGANYLVTDEPRAADGTTSNTYPRGNVRTKSDRNWPLSLCFVISRMSRWCLAAMGGQRVPS